VRIKSKDPAKIVIFLLPLSSQERGLGGEVIKPKAESKAFTTETQSTRRVES